MKENNTHNQKHQLAQFFLKGKLIATCKLSDLDLSNIKIRNLGENKYLLESNKFQLAWLINEPVKNIDLFIDDKKNQEIEVKSILSDYYPLFDKLYE